MEPKRNRINWQLLFAVAAGTANKRELELFDAWICEEPEKNQQIFDEVKGDMCTEDTDSQPTDKFTAYEKLAEKINKVGDDKLMVSTKKQKLIAFVHWKRVAAVAAGLILLFGTGFWANNLQRYRNQKVAGAMSVPELKEIQVGFGRMVKMTLADGSVIRLAPGSKFKYPKTFASTERRVYLDGEAFFQVTRDTAHPFIIQTTGLETRVLGTSFNIEAFGNQLVSKVTVATGKVSVSKHLRGTKPQLLAYLTPNHQIEFDSTNDHFKVSKLAENMVNALKDGKLVFDGATLKEIMESLQRRYGVIVHFQDKKMEKMLLTVTLEYKSIDHMALMLEHATNLEVRHQQGHLYFERR